MKYAIINGKILNGKKDMSAEEGLCVLVDGEKISKILPLREANTEGYKIIDLNGKYLMPGLVNMHVHLAGNGKPQKKQRDNEKLVKTIMSTALTRSIAYKMVSGFAKTELMSGVTTIRTVGGLADFDTKLRDDILKGKKAGPRIHCRKSGDFRPRRAYGGIRRDCGEECRRGSRNIGKRQIRGHRYSEVDDYGRRSGRKRKRRPGRTENASRNG